MKILRKIKVKSVELKQRLKVKVNPTVYKFIAADITSNCNLRCPFCINDFSAIKGNLFMTEDTFDKALTLLPLAPVAGFGISCLYEPCLHPAFIRLMEKIPKKYFERVFFTTNLSVYLSDEELQRLSRCNIHHINISIDSLEPEIFERLRKGAKYDRFMDNLERLVRIFATAPGAPKIRFSTVVLQSNVDGIPQLLEACSKRFSASVHELRFVYQIPHVDETWKRENLISNSQWDQLLHYVENCPYTCEVVPPPDVYFPEDQMPYSRKPEDYSPPSAEEEEAELPLGLRVHSSGDISLYGRDDICFNLHDLENPFSFFNNRRQDFQKELEAHGSTNV